MLKRCTLLLLFFLNITWATAQIKPAAKTSTVAPKSGKAPKATPYLKWSVKAGVNLSVVYLARNVKDNNNTPGFCAGLNYEVNNFLRVSTLFTRFRPINIEPTWLNVSANTYEMNLEAVAHFPNKKTLLYPFIGLSYNTYSGFFTGQLDFLNLKEYYSANTLVKNRWLGVNFGTGLEHNFGMIGLFIDYRMRIGKQEKDLGINIMDVCYTGGIKVRFPYGKGARNFAKRFKTNDRFNLL